MTESFSEFDETRKEYISANPPTKEGLSKNVMFIKMVEGTNRSDRLLVANTILAVLED